MCASEKSQELESWQSTGEDVHTKVIKVDKFTILKKYSCLLSSDLKYNYSIPVFIISNIFIIRFFLNLLKNSINLHFIDKSLPHLQFLLSSFSAF
jgi:hypothetical protein